MAQVTSYPTQALTRLNFFSKREMIELPRLLMRDERVLTVISGIYTAGTAILCVTSRRILLVDKKLMRSSFEDVRFESIKEVNFSQQAIMASIRFYYAGREMQFRSWHRKELRLLAQMVQQKMFEVQERKRTASHVVDPNSIQTTVFEQEVVRPLYKMNPQLEQYLANRIARWRRASRFVDVASRSNKAGRQILSLETE